MFHLELAFHLWKSLLKIGDSVVDATCGNGKDTLKLCQLVLSDHCGWVFGLDIQEKALQSTRLYLKKFLTPSEQLRVDLFHCSHSEFPLAIQRANIQLIVYNLGYLPGGDKSLTTLKGSTLESVRKGLSLISPTGALSITCYPGHPQGKEEEDALIDFTKDLDGSLWRVVHHRSLNRPSSPSLLFIQKNYRA